MKHVWFALALSALAVCQAAKPCDSDVCRDGRELITSKGYPFEDHFTITDDGYILALFRIPHGISNRLNATNSPKPAVLLQHGLLDSSDTWILNPAEGSLAFILADAGFDVWLGNTRGNKYSRNSTQYNPDRDKRFWAWSYDEMQKYDVPAMINYIVGFTGLEKIGYVGHSQGTTIAFTNFATPANSVADKVSVCVAMAPVAYLRNTGSLLLKGMSALGLDKLVALLGFHEFLPSSEILQVLLPDLCNATPGLCDSVIYLIAGFDAQDFNQSRMDVYMSHFPSGTSTQEIEHYAQSVHRDIFEYYDFGLENPIKYHRLTPPAYDLSAIHSPPISLIYGGKDDLADPTDVQKIIDGLPEDTLDSVIELKEFGHLDFVWGEYAYRDLYPAVVKTLQKYA